jgi:hypothetical protein
MHSFSIYSSFKLLIMNCLHIHVRNFVLSLLMMGILQVLSGQSQWLPQFSPASSPIYRTGNVGIGITQPLTPLHISVNGGSLLSPDQKPSEIPQTPTGGNTGFLVRLDKVYTEATYRWAVDGGVSLDFLREDNGAFSKKMSLNALGMRVFGTQVSIGTLNEQLNLGYSPAGQYLSMGYRPMTATSFQSLGGGGVVMYGDGAGLWGLATKSGGTINITDDTRLVVDKEGNAGLGTREPQQRMHLHDAANVAVRLSTAGGGDWDLAADGDAKVL